ncbi:hypothetical protein AB6D56_04770 [Vibrio lentus]
MQTNNDQKQAIILCALLIIGSTFFNVDLMLASTGEQVISFVSSLITYVVIICLLLRFTNVDVISSNYRILIGVSFVGMTILENVYPVILYSDQIFITEYYVIFCIELVLSIYVTNVIINVSNILGHLGRVSLLDSLQAKIKGRRDSKAEATRVYKKLYPVLELLLDQGYSFDSLEVKGIVKVLGDLPALGKKRENFAKSYLRDEFTLRKLPRDPSHFEGQTLWH